MNTDDFPIHVYLNGKFVNKSNALISPEDRGFMFSDGVYEVIKVYKGKPFRMQDHMQRLQRSLMAVQITTSGINSIAEAGMELIKRNKLQHTYAGIYIQVTRGAHPRKHEIPVNIAPTIYISTFIFPNRYEYLNSGIAVISREDIRWLHCDIKSVSLLPNTLLYNEAFQQNAGECILHRNGFLTEATHSNVAIVKDGVFITPPNSNLILPGITKKVVMEICKDLGVPMSEEPVVFSATTSCNEMMVMGTGNEVTPVIAMDNKPIGNGKPGNLTRKLQSAFFELTYGQLASDYWWK